jgi:monoamine oxidase
MRRAAKGVEDVGAEQERTFTRRTAVGAGAAAGAGLVLPSGSPAAKQGGRRRRKHVDVEVAVVGAGFAGLTAAVELKQAGRSVVVLEARDRVGGRVAGHELENGQMSERGGTFVGPTQDRVLAALKRYGLKTFPTFNDGANVYVNSGDRSTFEDTGPTGSAPPDPLILAELATVVAQLDDMSTSVPVDAPWQAPDAANLDRQTLEDYIRANSVSERFRRLVPAATRPIFGAEPRELSLLFVLFYIAASGNERNPGTFERNFNTRNGAQENRVVGGSQRLGERLAEELGGKRIHKRSPVRRIIQRKGHVKVVSDRVVVHAERVIVAIPPVLAGRIDYTPKLPAERDSLTQRLAQGTLTKVAAAYDKPFWREKGLNGSALSTDGLVNATFDDTPFAGDPGIIFGFVGGDASRTFAGLKKEQKRARVLAEYATYFGDEALSPTEFFYTQWPEQQWSRGGPVGIYPPGLLTAYGAALRKPIGRIHWAGTETSTYWNGYMDGAIRSGERAAAEVLDRT